MKRLTLLFAMLLFAASLFNAQAQNSPKFSGLMFGDYYYNAQANNGANKDLNGFQLRRIYITADYAISENFTSRFRVESDQTSGSNTAGGKYGVMVKDAWLKWANIFTGSDLIFGLSPTPAFDVSESAWGHRYLEKTIMDFNGIVPSRDMGIDLKGKFDQGGMVKYWLKIGNNSSNGASNTTGAETDKFKRYYGLLEFDPSANLLITVYGDFASAAKVHDAVAGSDVDNSSFVGAAFVNYRQKGSFSVGVEGFIKSTQDGYTPNAQTALSSKSGNGISIWGYVNLTESMQVVARYDGVDPNTASTSINDFKTLGLLGLQFNPVKNVAVTPNIEYIHYQAAPTAGGNAQDVVPRVTFNWEF